MMTFESKVYTLVMFLIIETLKNKVVLDKRGFQRIGQARI